MSPGHLHVKTVLMLSSKAFEFSWNGVAIMTHNTVFRGPEMLENRNLAHTLEVVRIHQINYEFGQCNLKTFTMKSCTKCCRSLNGVVVACRPFCAFRDEISIVLTQIYIVQSSPNLTCFVRVPG